MKRKVVIENNIDMLSVVRDIAKRESNNELLSWSTAVSDALKWIVNNDDKSNIAISKCNIMQELEVMKEMEFMNWDD